MSRLSYTPARYETRYQLRFSLGEGCFYGFGCDANGVVDRNAVGNRDAFIACLAGKHGPGEVHEYEVKIPSEATYECDRCGEEWADNPARFTITCPQCETDYNGSGQRLAPREQWGWETGETAADLNNIGLDDDQY